MKLQDGFLLTGSLIYRYYGLGTNEYRFLIPSRFLDFRLVEMVDDIFSLSKYWIQNINKTTRGWAIRNSNELLYKQLNNIFLNFPYTNKKKSIDVNLPYILQ